MIGPNELRQILREDADEAPHVTTQELLIGVRHKVKIRRRVSLATACAAIAVLVVASLTILPRFVTSSSPAPVDPVRKQLEFPQRVDDNFPVITSHVNAAHGSSFDWPVKLDWNDKVKVPRAQPYAFCRLPAAADLSGGQVVAALAFNGHPVANIECTSGEGQRSSDRLEACEIHNVGSPDWPTESDIATGETIQVSMWLKENSDVIEVPGAELGAAFALQPRSILRSRVFSEAFGHSRSTC